MIGRKVSLTSSSGVRQYRVDGVTQVNDYISFVHQMLMVDFYHVLIWGFKRNLNGAKCRHSMHVPARFGRGSDLQGIYYSFFFLFLISRIPENLHGSSFSRSPLIEIHPWQLQQLSRGVICDGI